MLGVLVCGVAGCVIGANYLLNQSPELRGMLGIDQTFSLLTFVPVMLNAARAGRQNLLEFVAALAYAACCVALASTYVLRNKGVPWTQQLLAVSTQALWILAVIWLVVMLLFMRGRARRIRQVEREEQRAYAEWGPLL